MGAACSCGEAKVDAEALEADERIASLKAAAAKKAAQLKDDAMAYLELVKQRDAPYHESYQVRTHLVPYSYLSMCVPLCASVCLCVPLCASVCLCVPLCAYPPFSLTRTKTQSPLSCTYTQTRKYTPHRHCKAKRTQTWPAC